MGSPVIRCGLLWHSLTSGNLGVDALTQSNLAIVEEEARKLGLVVQFVIVGMRDRRPGGPRRNDIEIFDITWRRLLSPSGYWELLRSLDCLIDIGAGDSWTDIYGFKRFALLWLTKWLAGIRCVPLLFAPQTIGPFQNGSIAAWLASKVMSMSCAVVARDDASFAAARLLAPKAHCVLATDVAFRLPYVAADCRSSARKLRIGINVSGLLFNQAVTGSNRFGLSYDYALAVRRIVATLLSNQDAEILLLTHANSFDADADDDGAICDQLAKEFPSTQRVPDFADASSAKSFISGLDMLVAARMHACVAAFSSNTPFLALSYSRKFPGLFNQLGFDRIIPVEGLDTDQVVELVVASIERRSEIQAEIKSGAQKVDSLLDNYRQEVSRLLGSAREQRN